MRASRFNDLATISVLLFLSLTAPGLAWAQESPKESVQKAIVDLKSPDFKVRDRALKALIKKGKDAIPPLLTALRTARSLQESYRLTPAISAIGRYVPEALPLIAKGIDEEKNAKTRRYLVEATQSMGAKSERRFVPSYEKCLLSKDVALKLSAIEALARLGKEADSAVPALLKLLSKESNARVKQKVIEALRRIGRSAKKALSVLQGFMVDEDPLVRAEAISTVSHFEKGSGQSLEAFIKALEDKHKAVLCQTLSALQGLGAKAKAALKKVQSLTKHQDKSVRAGVASALGAIGREDPQTVTALVSMLEDKETRVAVLAVVSLGRMGPVAKPAVPKLIARLEKSSRYGLLESEVADALGRIGEKELSIPALKRALKSPHSDVQRAAKRALKFLERRK